MKWLLILTVSVMLLEGCATEEADTPAFAEGQAIALVKEVVRDKYSREGLYLGSDKWQPEVIS